MIDSGSARRRRLATPDWRRGATNMLNVCVVVWESCESCRGEDVYIHVNTLYNCVDDLCSHSITGRFSHRSALSEAIHKDRLTVTFNSDGPSSCYSLWAHHRSNYVTCGS